MYFDGLRIQVAGAGLDASMGAFTDGQVATYDAAAAQIRGGVSFASGFAADDVPVWNGSTFTPKQRSIRRVTGASQTSTSVTYADITNLNITINRIGQYAFEYWILYSTSAVGEGIGLQLALTGVAATCDYTIDLLTAPATRASLVTANAFGSGLAPQTAGPGATNVCAYILGSCNITTVGVLSCQLRAETGGANSATARVGCWCHVFAL